MLINPLSDLDEQDLSQHSKEQVVSNEMEVQFDSDSEKSTKPPIDHAKVIDDSEHAIS
jgi:hypothetical protein